METIIVDDDGSDYPDYMARSLSPASSGTVRGDSPQPSPRNLDQADIRRPSVMLRTGKSPTPSGVRSRRKRKRSTSPQELRRRKLISRSAHRIGDRQPVEVIDLTDEAKLELEFDEPAISPEQRRAFAAQKIPVQRNPEILLPFRQVESTSWGLTNKLRIGKMVELRDRSFLKICALYKHTATDEVKICGWPCIRVQEKTKLNGALPDVINDCFLSFQQDEDDPRPVEDQSTVQVSITDIIKIRRAVWTNHSAPAYSHNSADLPQHILAGRESIRLQYIKDNEVLVVRWRYTIVFKNATDRQKNLLNRNNFTSTTIEKLKPHECSHNMAISLIDLKSMHRGEKPAVLGGSGYRLKPKNYTCKYCQRAYAEPNRLRLHLPEHAHEQKRRHFKVSKSIQWKEDASKKFLEAAPVQGSEQQYTFGDGFCGAGGMSSGAKAAGLRLVWAIDHWDSAAATFRKNFSTTQLFEKSIDKLFHILDPLHNLFVDILHLSPPCPTFSPNHTKPGKDDDDNYAAQLSIGAVLQKCKPRIVTLEQTFGLLFPRHSNWFHSLIRQFVDLGYDVSWQVESLQNFGLPSSRRRLIILAAAPGETLPKMPTRTHGDSPGLKPYNTPANVIAAIPGNAPNHDIAAVTSKGSKYAPWDGSRIGPCITTEHRGHPRGHRGLTIREYAALQTFPNGHIFEGQYQIKQIGNAVPPVFAKMLMEAVKKHLQKCDGVDVAEEQRDGREIIELDWYVPVTSENVVETKFAYRERLLQHEDV